MTFLVICLWKLQFAILVFSFISIAYNIYAYTAYTAYIVVYMALVKASASGTKRGSKDPAPRFLAQSGHFSTTFSLSPLPLFRAVCHLCGILV